MTQTQVEPKAKTFSLKTRLVSQGVENNIVMQAERMWVWMKVYAEGGENFLHRHTTEDHCFIILDGEATFHDKEGNDTVLRKWQGIFLPMGTFYSFTSTGDVPLVLLRVGAGAARERYFDDREWPAGVSDSRVFDATTVMHTGAFFGDPDA